MTSRQRYSSSEEESFTDSSDSSSYSSSGCLLSPCCSCQLLCCKCISDKCNSQICCAYIIGMISSSLIVGGMYLSLIRWNRLWMSLSIFGFVLIFLGSALFYCGSRALSQKQRRMRSRSRQGRGSRGRHEAGDRDYHDDHHSNRPAAIALPRGGKRRRRDASGTRRSLSQLSLNMIPQYFAPGDTACPGTSSGHAVHTSSSSHPRHPASRSNTLLTNASVGSSDADRVSAASASVPFSQIFSVNGQSFLILPISNDSVIPSVVSAASKPLHSDSCSSSVGPGTSVSQRNSLAIDPSMMSLPLDSLLVKVPDDEGGSHSGLFR